MVREDQEVGQVTGRVYWQYIVAYGTLSFAFLILLWSSEQVGSPAWAAPRTGDPAWAATTGGRRSVWGAWS